MLRIDANTYDVFLENSLNYLSEDDKENNNEIDKSVDGKPISNEIIENSKTKGIIGKIGGIGADSNEPTRNGRRYPLELWQNVEKSEYFIEGMENRTLIGEADHPQERLDYSVTEGAVVLTKYEIQNDGKVYTEFDILDTIPGRTVKTYFDAGCRLGVSSRGLGEEVMRNGEKIIDPETYQFYCFDVVAFPAVKSARMELIESTSPKKQKLINSITSEINKCKSLDEVRYVESISKGADLYLDEIKEAIEIKKEEFNKTTAIANCDNPEAAAKAAEDLLNSFEKIAEVNRTKADKQFIEYLKSQLDDYASSKKESIENSVDELQEVNSSELDNQTFVLHNKAWGTHKKLTYKELKQYFVDWVDQDPPFGYETFKEWFDECIENGTITSSTQNDTHNNKIKISEQNLNSDEDTTEGKDDSDLEILAEIQEKLNVKDSEILTLQSQLEQKTNVIKNLIAKSYNQTTKLEEKTNISKQLIYNQRKCESLKQANIALEQDKLSLKDKLSKVSSKYENLQKVNQEFSTIIETLNKKYINEKELTESLKNEVNILKNNASSLKQKNGMLQESLKKDKINSKQVLQLSESVSTLKAENNDLKVQNEAFKVKQDKQSNHIKKLTSEVNVLSKQCVESLDKYISVICTKYNLKETILRRLLGENYTISDVDKIAKELVENNTKINSLPFAHLVPDRHVVTENVGLQESINNDNETMDNFHFMLESKNN